LATMENRTMIIVSSFVLALFLIATINRNYTWSSEKLLWQDVVDKSPSLASGHLNLARDYHRSGNREVALREYQKAMDLSAGYLNVNHNDFRNRDILVTAQTDVGLMMMQYQDDADAEASLNGALRIMPHYGPADLLLSQLYNEHRRYMEAIALLDGAIVAQNWGPSFHGRSQIYFNRAVAFCGIGNKQAANENFNYAAMTDRTIDQVECH